MGLRRIWEARRLHGSRAGQLFGIGQLGRRLALAFVAVALAALAVDAVFESARLQAKLVPAGIAAVIALVVSLVVARAITGPLEQLLAAVRSHARGDRQAQIRPVHGIGVIRELLDSYNQSAIALEKQDRLRRQVIADVAHELRTPVAVLQASLEAMLDGVTDLTPTAVAAVHDEVLRVATMVRDVQRLAAAESASLQPEVAVHDLADLATDAVHRMGEAFRAADVTLELRLSEAWVLCDPGLTHQVISNLLTNSLKFTPGGTVAVTVEPDGEGLASVCVSDTGIGIAPEELPHVTDRFYRGARAAEVAAGSGIGLAVVAELVAAQNGQLEIRSSADNGTQVRVRLPTATPESTQLALHRSDANRGSDSRR